MWRNCIASITLDQEVDARWPNRDTSLDGTIGDAAHASRKSDHNPWIKDSRGTGVVRARDIDEDLDGTKVNGVGDANAVFWILLDRARKGDRRFKNGGYFIYEDVIYSEKTDFQGEPYGGSNKHRGHLHISWSKDGIGYDSRASYGIAGNAPKRIYKIGDRGPAVAFLVDMINILSLNNAYEDKNWSSGHTLYVPKDIVGRNRYLFTCDVHVHVENFQRFLQVMWVLAGAHGKPPALDGIAGPETLGAIAFWIPIAMQD